MALGNPNSVVGYAWDGPGEWEFSDCGMQSVAYFLPPSARIIVAQHKRNVKMKCEKNRNALRFCVPGLEPDNLPDANRDALPLSYTKRDRIRLNSGLWEIFTF